MKPRIKIGLILCCCFVLQQAKSQTQEEFARANKYMIDIQLKTRGINDQQVLQAFRKVPRHRFVLPGYVSMAYIDSPLPIEEGQTISQPYVVAFMTQALKLKNNDRVLEIGTGSGYQAAILSQICDSVFSIEIHESLSKKAWQKFVALNYSNIVCKKADGYKGWAEKAPFDAIIVTCSPTHIPEALQQQLAEGGRMIIPVGDEPVQVLVLLEKNKGKIVEKKVLPVKFVPMVDSRGNNY